MRVSAAATRILLQKGFTTSNSAPGLLAWLTYLLLETSYFGSGQASLEACEKATVAAQLLGSILQAGPSASAPDAQVWEILDRRGYTDKVGCPLGILVTGSWD